MTPPPGPATPVVTAIEDSSIRGSQRSRDYATEALMAVQSGQDSLDARSSLRDRMTAPVNFDDHDLAVSTEEVDPAVGATFDTQMQKFLAALGGRASISSGKRSTERQKQLWEEALAKYGDPEVADNWVARPGTSNHERDLARDLKYADDSVREEAHRIAAEYGLWFPMANEPWHVEPISTRKRRG